MADFNAHLGEFDEHGVQVLAASSDPLEEAQKTVELLELGYTVLYGLDLEATSAAIGCYTGEHEGRPHLQPASFILKADGTIALATYSSGKVGRLTAADTLEIVRKFNGSENTQE